MSILADDSKILTNCYFFMIKDLPHKAHKGTIVLFLADISRKARGERKGDLFLSDERR